MNMTAGQTVCTNCLNDHNDRNDRNDRDDQRKKELDFEQEIDRRKQECDRRKELMEEVLEERKYLEDKLKDQIEQTEHFRERRNSIIERVGRSIINYFNQLY
jgi:hypothetical protein